MECNAKNMFSQKMFIGDSRVEVLCFFEAQGAGILSFSALETGLKMECFLRSPWGSWMAPENKDTSGSGLKMPVWIGTNNLSTTSWVITLAKD